MKNVIFSLLTTFVLSSCGSHVQKIKITKSSMKEPSVPSMFPLSFGDQDDHSFLQWYIFGIGLNKKIETQHLCPGNKIGYAVTRFSRWNYLTLPFTGLISVKKLQIFCDSVSNSK